jgi:tetratricopeptide (TPR) repeat protein
MIANYTGLLQSQPALDARSRADANFWIGWGHFKREEWAEAIPFLDSARTLNPTRFKDPAGVHIVLAAYSLLDSEQLKAGVDRLIVDAPAQRLPTRMLTWLGLERFAHGDYEGADRFLSMASTPDEPTLTDDIVWRHIVKARIERRHFDRALTTLDILLVRALEKFWKADALLDKSHALIGTEKWEEARAAAHEALQLDPQGTVRAGLYMALADIAMHRQDYESAAASYLRTSEMFIDDREIKPLALFRAADAFEKNGQEARAADIRKQLRSEFPNWNSAKR